MADAAAENGGGRHAEIRGQTRGQITTSDTPDTVRTEETVRLIPRFTHVAPARYPALMRVARLR